MPRTFRPTIALIALGACFFGSLAWAAACFPKAYDWRYTVISSLASPRDNPHAYWIASAGLAVTGLVLLPFPFFLQKRLGRFAPHLMAWGGRFFVLGAISLTLSALIVPGHYRLLGIGRTHEHLAQISSVGFCLSLILYLGTILRLPPSLFLIRVMSVVAVILPVTALIVSRLSLFLAYECCSPMVYRAVKASLWSSLALWEWVGAVSIYLFLALTIYALPEGDLQSEPRK